MDASWIYLLQVQPPNHQGKDFDKPTELMLHEHGSQRQHFIHVKGSHRREEQGTKVEWHIQQISTMEFTYNAWQIVFLMCEYHTSCIVYFISHKNKEEQQTLGNRSFWNLYQLYLTKDGILLLSFQLWEICWCSVWLPTRLMLYFTFLTDGELSSCTIILMTRARWSKGIRK